MHIKHVFTLTIYPLDMWFEWLDGNYVAWLSIFLFNIILNLTTLKLKTKTYKQIFFLGIRRNKTMESMKQ